jgi:hypothetical protein
MFEEVAVTRSKRHEEVKLAADHLRVLHKVAGGVCVLFIEEADCPFGYSIPHGLEGVVLPILPARLREIADRIELGLAPPTLKPQTRLE